MEKLLTAAKKADGRIQARKAAIRSIQGGTKGRRFAERGRAPRVPQYPMWLALLTTGARWTELTSTTWGDLDEAVGTLRIRASTASASRRIRASWR